MMMTQSHYGGELDSFHRASYPGHRAPINSGHYERPAPYTYGYFEPQYQDVRSEYPPRHGRRSLIQEPIAEAGSSTHSRRRIPVACTRCRKRKIKCTGDPGDGSGCSACRTSGADKYTCTFSRVGSQIMGFAPGDAPSTSTSVPETAPVSVPYSADTSSSSYSGGYQTGQQRPVLPILQTRTAYPDYEPYGTSPLDEYTYASTSISKQESLSSTHNPESFRAYATNSGTTPSTAASMHYEPGVAFSFGSLQASPAFPQPTPIGRLSNPTSEALSPLNMSSLHSSLPTQTMPGRRLPTPNAQQQQPTYADVPQIRPLSTSSQSRAYISGIHSRDGMPWSTDGQQTPRSGSSCARGSLSLHSLPSLSTPSSEPSFGYQFSTEPPSPDALIAGPALSEASSSTSGSSTAGLSMLPPSSTVRSSVPYSMSGLPAVGGVEDRRRPRSSHEAASRLYSFSSGIESSERSTASRPFSQAGDGDDRDGREHFPQQGYARTDLRYSQPHHSASVEGLRHRSSHDQQQQQHHQHHAANTHRMSVVSLNTR